MVDCVKVIGLELFTAIVKFQVYLDTILVACVEEEVTVGSFM